MDAYPNVDSDENVELDLFGENDFRDEQRTLKIPEIWTDPVAVREIATDTLQTVSYAVPSNATFVQPIEVVPKVANNQRKRVILLAFSQVCFIGNTPDPMERLVIGGVTYVSNGFRLPTGVPVTLDTSQGLWAVSGGGAGTFAILSVITEGYSTR